MDTPFACYVCVTDMHKQTDEKVQHTLQEDKLDSIVCVAGGWAGGNAASAGMWCDTALLSCSSLLV